MGTYIGSKNTNCLTYTPKNINLELSNGTLTLKKGSKVYVPNGFSSIKYYKYTYTAWTRPNLTTDGTLGGDSFAVAADTTWSGYPIYQAVDGDDSTRWLAAKNSTNSSFIFYNPKPLKVTKINVTKQHTDSGIYASAGDVYGSNDNSNWYKLGSFTGGTYNNGFSCDLSSNNKAYKYHRITPTTTVTAGWGISELQITATQQTGSVESTSSDYDYTVGDGSMKFDEIVIESDLSSTGTGYTTITNRAVYVDIKNKKLICYANGGSGSSPSYSSGNLMYYRTDNNVMENYTGGSLASTGVVSLPILRVSNNESQLYGTITQIFDWCGYIGSTAFVLPKIKGLIPNGFNADGTYKSTEFETDRVLIKSVSGTTDVGMKLVLRQDGNFNIWWSDRVYSQKETPTVHTYGGSLWYNPSTNLCKYHPENEGDWSDLPAIVVGDIQRTISNSVANITSLTPYSAKTTNDSIKIKDTGAYGVYLGSQNTNCLTYTPKNINLALDPINVNIVGTPTISNSVVSGFSSSNYVYISKTLPFASASKIEIVVKAKSNNISGLQAIIGNADDNYTTGGIVLRTDGASRLYCWGTNNNTSWGLAKFDTGLDLTTDFRYIKVSFTPTLLSFAISTNNSTWTNGNSIAIGGLTNMTVRFGLTGTKQPLNGSIDLLNSYIKVNDAVWWKGGTGNLTLKKGSKVYIPSGFDTIRYYKYTYATWTQPVLTADGVLGGDDFAVFCDSPNNTSYPAYYAFDSSTSTFAVTHEADYIIYNKNPINITKIDMTVRGSSYNYRGGTLYGSNDNINWKEIIALSALTNGSWDISSNTGYYKYYKFSGSAGDWQPKTLTLTATQQTGSVESTSTDYDYTVGNGKSKFDEVVIANDIVNKDIGSSTTDLFILDIGNNTISGFPNTICFSGDTAPTITGWALWYDTANNLMKYKDATSSWITVAASLPFCKGTWSGSILSSINQIFDWCGCIGSTVFVLPGVKGLIPNGFNADGTYKSIETEATKVITATRGISGSGKLVLGTSDFSNYVYAIYDKTLNQNLSSAGDNINRVVVGEWSADSLGTITSLTPYAVQTTTTFIPIAAVYNGSNLIYQYNSYTPETIILNTATAGTYTVTLKRGQYYIALTGAGGRANGGYYYACFQNSGGSGGTVAGNFYVDTDTTVTVVVGAGQSGKGNASTLSVGSTQMIYADGGNYCHANGSCSGNTGGSANSINLSGKLSNINLKAIVGNNGVYNTGKAQGAYSNDPISNTRGQGATSNDCNIVNGVAGGVYIKYIQFNK